MLLNEDMLGFAISPTGGIPAGLIAHIFSHPDFTVGYGIAPYQLLLADYTAGQELHLAPKTVIFSVNYL